MRFLVVGAIALAAGWVAPALAQPRDLSPRIVLVFDTSGSMGSDLATGRATGGDNSAEYPGDGGTSRLSVAKDAVRALVTTTSEVDWSLMRYPQFEGLGINRGPIDGFQNNTYAGLAQQPLNYGGSCDGQVRAAPDRAHALLVPFAEDNEPAILGWLDHHEAWPGDRELRAEGPTPIVQTLELAGAYLREVLAADPELGCRRYSVVLLTDGGESCVPDAERAARLEAQAQALRRLVVERGGERFEVDVRTFVVAFSVSVNGAERLAGLARAGGTAVDAGGALDLQRGLPYRAEDLGGLRAAFGRILREAVPVEACNALDDDCDGRVDEGALNACGQCGPVPPEICDGQDDDCDQRIDEGVLNACGVCGPTPAEICNGIDEDCDGRVDEGLPANCNRCAPGAEEVCNGLDDDCDGRVDNQRGSEALIERPCGQDVGACTTGVERCARGRWSGCSGVQPADESCDDVDNDCDGAIDEATRPCGPEADLGECRVGARACDTAACEADPAACGADGWVLACVGAVEPTEEICDGRDNDCDGQADEQLFNACGQCGPPAPEACNGQDDNCDGRVDEDALCPPAHICHGGECVQRCDASGECSAGLTCVSVYRPDGAFCHPALCDALRCEPGFVCDAALRGCADPCLNVACAEGEGCDLGECVPATCRHTGCPEGQRCVDDACAPDPCAGIACDEGQFCREGACVAPCVGQACAEGRTCVDGACADDPCGGRCLPGQRCDPTDGLCVADPCLGVACPIGTVCDEGACSGDAPCVHVRCPPGTTCRDGGCTDLTPNVAPVSRRPDAGLEPDGGAPADAGPADATPAVADAEPITDAGGPPPPGDGGGCRAAGGGPAALWLLLPLLALRRRRR